MPGPPGRATGNVPSRNVDEAELRRAIARLPESLPIWHAGRRALPGMLQLLAIRRIERSAREGTHPALRAPEHLRLTTNSADMFRHATASIVSWSSEYLRDESSLVSRPAVKARTRANGKTTARVGRRVDRRDIEGACDLAFDWQELEVVDVGLATRDLTMGEHKGRHIWIHNQRRPEIEVLDIILAGVTVLDEPTDFHEVAETREWFERNRGRPERIHSLPESIRRSAWEEAHGLLVQQGTTIPEATDLGGLSLRDARSCYALLIAQLHLNELASIHFGTEQTLVWAIRPANLVKLLARYVDPQAAAAFLEFCRYVPGRSPLSAPLIPHGDLLLIPAPLVALHS